ncbi:MAG: hypothetical protein ABL902_01285 [Gallionella sp.]|nr:hypothetical protein [Gallionella sp.]
MAFIQVNKGANYSKAAHHYLWDMDLLLYFFINPTSLVKLPHPKQVKGGKPSKLG